MIVCPVARRIYTAVITIDAQANIVARRYMPPGCCQEPMKTVISATKPLRPGSPSEHKTGDHENGGNKGHYLQQAAQPFDQSRMRPVIDHPDGGKEKGRHQPMRDHLHDGAP
jgi:hypothetical protein